MGKQRVMNTIQRYRSFRYALILQGIVIGVVSGLVVVAFRLLLEQADIFLKWVIGYEKAHPWFIPVWFLILIAAGIVTACLLRWEPLISGSGIPQVEGEIEGQIEQKWWRVLLGKCAGGILSIGCGLSLGREGPSIQLGAMAAKGVSRLQKRGKTEEKFLMTCGASAGLAAAFNAPIAGVLFSLEEVHKHFSPEILLSSMAASITADFVSRNVFGLHPVFDFQVNNMIPLASYGHVLLLGILLGFFGVLYNVCLAKSQDLYKKISNQFVKLVIPFLLAGVFALLYPSVLGGGHTLVETMASGEMVLGTLCLLFVLKFGFSMLSFGSGAPGGIFLPLLVMGAVVGGAYVSLIGTVSSSLNGLIGNFIILGMAGFFSAIVRAPITGIILICEMTGSFSHLLALSLVALLAYIVPDLLGIPPVYDMLLERLLAGRKKKRDVTMSGEKILVEAKIYHGCKAEKKQIRELEWPRSCLVVSLVRKGMEIVPRGDTMLMAGDRIVVLCDETMEGILRQMLKEHCETVQIVRTR